MLPQKMVSTPLVLTVHMKLVANESIKVLGSIRCLLLCDEKPNRVERCWFENTGIDACSSDYEERLQFAPGIDMTLLKRLRGVDPSELLRFFLRHA